jgi:hypothetical protein
MVEAVILAKLIVLVAIILGIVNNVNHFIE